MNLKKQHGVSLVEMMVSLVLSMALIAGIGSLFVQMQKSNKTQQAVSNMMDDARFVQEILQKEIRRTGGLRSKDDKKGRSEKVFLSTPELWGSGMNFDAASGVPPEGEYIVGISGTPNDSLIFRYQLIDMMDLSVNDPANTASPCTKDLLLNAGEDPAKDVHIVTIHLFLSSGNLMCESRRDWIDPANPANSPDPTVLANVKNQLPSVLISNVKLMKVTYGVDSNNDFSADYYTDANNVPPEQWNDVVSLRLSLLLNSTEENIMPSGKSYSIDETSYTASDTRLYRVYTTTIALRNTI